MALSDVYDPTKTLEDYKQMLIEKIFKIDSTIDTSDGTPMGDLISLHAIALDTVLQLSMKVYADMSPQTASFEALRNFYGAYYGVSYLDGTHTLQPLKITITQPCTIYAKATSTRSQFEVTDNVGNVYVPTKDYTFENAGTFDVIFMAKNQGAIKSDVNSINNIMTTTLGVVKINNPQSYSYLGTLAQSEETYRENLLIASRLYRSKGNVVSLESALKSAGASDALVVKNLAAETAYEVPGGYITVIIKGQESEELNKKIATLLEENIQSAKMYAFDNIGVEYTIYQERVNCVVIFNYATQLQYGINITFLECNLLTDKQEELKEYIVLQLEERNLKKIYTPITITSIADIIDDFFKKNSVKGFVAMVKFYKTSTPSVLQNLATLDHVYQYVEVVKENINFVFET